MNRLRCSSLGLHRRYDAVPLAGFDLGFECTIAYVTPRG
jgi:hypothetical protein